jgi:hypothetical protein
VALVCTGDGVVADRGAHHVGETGTGTGIDGRVEDAMNGPRKKMTVEARIKTHAKQTVSRNLM